MPLADNIPAAQIKWDAIYESQRNNPANTAADVLQNNLHFLPNGSHNKALEIACGLGANALFLASKGLSVDAWDISPIAIDKLKQHPQFSDNIHPLVCDVLQQPIPEGRYDLIIVTHFLERSIVANIVAGLKPNGRLYYQTFLKNTGASSGPKSPRFLLDKNELLRLFSALNVLHYQEETQNTGLQSGVRSIAMLVAEKPGNED